MTSEAPYHFERTDLEAILLADNAGVRSRFQDVFAELIRRFLDQSHRVCGELRNFSRALARDLRGSRLRIGLPSRAP